MSDPSKPVEGPEPEPAAASQPDAGPAANPEAASDPGPLAPAPGAKRRFYQRKRFLIPLGLLAVVAMALLVLGQPRAPEPAPVADATTTRLAEQLASAGITDALVDVTAQRALVRYEVPAGADAERVMYVVLGAAERVAPASERAVLQVFRSGAPKEEVVAAMADVHAFASGALTQAAFEARLDRHPLA